MTIYDRKRAESAKYQNYWRNPEEGYPKMVYWRKFYGPGTLDELQFYDLVFNRKDEKKLRSL